MSKRDEKVEEPPKICPFMAIAYGHICKDFDEIPTLEEPSHYGNDVICRKQKCAFYLEKMPGRVEKCIWVRLAITLGNIWASMERPRGTSIMERNLERRRKSFMNQLPQ